MTLQELTDQGWRLVKVVKSEPTYKGFYVSILAFEDELAGYRTSDNTFWILTEEDKQKYGI